jgi:NitT/TauT family transport system ATP-binding protein
VTAVVPKVEVQHVSKEFGDGDEREVVVALDDISFVFHAGEFVSLLGPSGCGKTTLLHIIAGFERATRGDVRVDGRPVRGPGADRGMVFQDYALFPWKTLLENVMFGPLIAGVPRPEAERRAREFIGLVGLGGFERRYPHELSGGMRQRCALARAVANNPDVLLMDEPLAAIDALTRNALQEEILKVCAGRDGAPRKTVVYVTHSIEEAVFLSDRIVLMTPRPGRILDVVAVPFGPVRDDATRLHPEFSRLVGEIWQSLKVHMKGTTQGGQA